MEINGSNPLIHLNAGVQKLDAQATQQVQRPKNAGREGLKPGSDRIELSVRSLQIQHLDAAIQAASDIRVDRLEQIRSAVVLGTYNVKAEKIADKILSGSLIDEVF